MAHKDHCGYYRVKWTNKGRHFFPRLQRVSNSLHDWCLQNTPDKNLSMLKKKKKWGSSPDDEGQACMETRAAAPSLCCAHCCLYQSIFWCNLIDTYVWKHANFFFFLSGQLLHDYSRGAFLCFEHLWYFLHCMPSWKTDCRLQWKCFQAEE